MSHKALGEITYSIVIPTFNRRKKLKQSIDSVLYQGEKSIEIIIIDDGSHDDTKIFVERWKKECGQIKYFYQNNSGASAARNLGVLNAKGKYVCFLDSDDCFLPGKFKAVDAFKEELDRGVILYSQVLIDNGRKEVVKPARGISESENIYDYLYVHDGFFPTPSLVMLREIALGISWNEGLGYGDDSDFVIMATSKGHKIKMIEDVLVKCDNTDGKDRLSMKKNYKEALLWYKAHEGFMSDSAKINFIIKHLAFSGFYKAPVFFIKSFLSGVLDSAVGFSKALKYFVRAVLPVRIYHCLRKML